MRLDLEVRHAEEATVVRCRGRITYRDEAAALSEKIADLLPHTRQLILELSGVDMIDGAGLGRLALMLSWARCLGCSIKLAAAGKQVRHVLELTKLASVFEICSGVEDAVLAFREQAAKDGTAGGTEPVSPPAGRTIFPAESGTDYPVRAPQLPRL